MMGQEKKGGNLFQSELGFELELGLELGLELKKGC
jgi:hypothetical protein